MKFKYQTREEWLIAAIELMRPLFVAQKYKVPAKIRVTCSWPVRGGLAGPKGRVLGQCWAPEASEDKVHQIFISPWMASKDKDATLPANRDVLPTLLHEVVHAVVGIDDGHNKVFGACARAVGLEGKLTATFAGEELMKTVAEWQKELGPYPHAKIDSTKSPVKKQTTRMVKCECKECDYAVRTSRKWIDFAGAPICPVKGHGVMKYTIPAELEREEDDE